MNWGDIIGGAVKQGLQKVPSVLGQAKQAYQGFKTDIPTYKAMADLAVRKAIVPKIEVGRYEEDAKNRMADMERVKGMTQKQMGEQDLKESWPWQPEANKSGSAEMLPYRVYPNDQALSPLKKAALDSMNLRPAMKKYLEQVPVQSADKLSNDGASGMAMRGGFQNPQYPQGGTWETDTYKNDQGTPGIIIDKDTLSYPYAQEVLQHEYLHNAPRTQVAQAGMTKLLSAIPENSIFRDAALQYFRDGRLPPNPEELFATLGEQLGQYALTLPEIQAYYNNIFSQPGDQSNEVGYSYEPWNLPTTPTENGISGYGREVGGEKLKIPVKIVTKRK